MSSTTWKYLVIAVGDDLLRREFNFPNDAEIKKAFRARIRSLRIEAGQQASRTRDIKKKMYYEMARESLRTLGVQFRKPSPGMRNFVKLQIQQVRKYIRDELQRAAYGTGPFPR